MEALQTPFGACKRVIQNLGGKHETDSLVIASSVKIK